MTNKQEKPNILFIYTDQQSAHMMSCAGNKYLNTPAMDSIAADGVRFERAYCTNPVCIPSRISLISGKMPSYFGVEGNCMRASEVPDVIKQNGLGNLLKDVGYDVAFGGKTHLPEDLQPANLGFEFLTHDERDTLAQVSADYIRRDRDKPFCLFSAFINPHDICYMAIREHAVQELDKKILEGGKTELELLDKALELPEGVDEQEFLANICPPLPDNYDIQEDEATAIEILHEERKFKGNARRNWTKKQWRYHRWAYHRLTEMVDKQIQVILDALDETGQRDNTVIIFSSDHGDMDSSHRLEHKTVFYEESAKIPFLVSWRGQSLANQVNNDNVISNGLDLIPTILDFAGAKIPEHLEGLSVKPLIMSEAPAHWRDAVQIENAIGRAIVSKDYKYMEYDSGENTKQLFDLVNDPGEMKNSINNPNLQQILLNHKEHFDRLHCCTTP